MVHSPQNFSGQEWLYGASTPQSGLYLTPQSEKLAGTPPNAHCFSNKPARTKVPPKFNEIERLCLLPPFNLDVSPGNTPHICQYTPSIAIFISLDRMAHFHILHVHTRQGSFQSIVYRLQSPHLRTADISENCSPTFVMDRMFSSVSNGLFVRSPSVLSSRQTPTIYARL